MATSALPGSTSSHAGPLVGTTAGGAAAPLGGTREEGAAAAPAGQPREGERAHGSTPASAEGGEASGTALAGGLVALLQPVVVEVDARLQEVFDSQHALAAHIDSLAHQLDRFQAVSRTPPLTPHIDKLLRAKARMVVINTTLANIQHRLLRLQRDHPRPPPPSSSSLASQAPQQQLPPREEEEEQALREQQSPETPPAGTGEQGSSSPLPSSTTEEERAVALSVPPSSTSSLSLMPSS